MKLDRQNTLSPSQFSLDGELLSRHEQSLCQQQQVTPPRPVRTSFFSFARRTPTSASSSMTSSRLTVNTGDKTPASSVGSVRSFRLDDSLMSTSSTGGFGGSQRSLDTSLVFRRGRPRTATIADCPPGTEPTTSAAAVAGLEQTTPSPLLIDADTAHLELRKQMEEMREQHGASWLLKQSQDDRRQEPATTTAPAAAADTAMEDASATTLSATPPTVVQTPPHVDQQSAGPARNARIVDTSDTSAYETGADLSDNDGNTDGRPVAADPLADIFPSRVDADDQPELVHSEPEDGEVMYIVTLQPSLADLFLVVSEANIRERDALTGETLTKWSISMLESCDRMRSDVLRLNFDTLNRDRRERIYRVETGLCQQLERYLRGILAQRPLSAMNQVQYRCVKCGACFSCETRDKLGRRARTETKCSACGSVFLVQVHERSATEVTAAAAAAAPAVLTPPPPPSSAAAPTRTAPARSEVVPVEEPTRRLEGSESQSSIGESLCVCVCVCLLELGRMLLVELSMHCTSVLGTGIYIYYLLILLGIESVNVRYSFSLSFYRD